MGVEDGILSRPRAQYTQSNVGSHTTRCSVGQEGVMAENSTAKVGRN